MTESRWDHHVPQTYLRAFAEGENLRVYPRATENSQFESRIRSVSQVAARRDLYTVKTERGRDKYIDENFQRVESLIPALFNPVSMNYELSDAQWDALKMLAAVQEIRSPQRIGALAQTIREEQEAIRFLYRENRPDLTDEEIEELIQERFGTEKLSGRFASNARNISLTVLNDATPEHAEDLTKLFGCIVTSDAHDFMTSDSPVVWFDAAQYPLRGFWGLDRQSLTVEVTYPLTRRKCLALARVPIMRYALAKAEAVSMINSRTSLQAQEMYAYPTADGSERLQQMNDLFCYWGTLPLLSVLIDDEPLAARVKKRIELVGNMGREYEEPCPRLQPDGRPTCIHGAKYHDDATGVCSKCEESPAAEFLPCSRMRKEGRDSQ